MQGPLSVNVGRVRVLEAMNMSVEAVRGLIKAVRVPIEVIGVPKEAVGVQHSHSLYNTLTTDRKFYILQAKRVDCRGFDSACRGRESVNRGRESVYRGLEMF